MDMAALVEFANVLRILEAKTAQADAAIINTMTIKVDDVIGLPGSTGSIELLTHFERVKQFFADPARLERSWADHNRVGRPFINFFSDGRTEQAARKEFPRVDPRSDGMIAECLLQRANESRRLSSYGR